MDENKEKLQDSVGESSSELSGDSLNVDALNEDTLNEADKNEVASSGNVETGVSAVTAAATSSAKKSDKPKASAKKEKSLGDRIKLWIREIVAEFNKIVWPNKKELWKMTLTVIITSIIFGVIVAGMDTVFRYAIGYLVNNL